MRIDLRSSTELEVTGVDRAGLETVGDAGGEGFGPLQMFAASLALCTASVLHVQATQASHADVSDLSITVRWRYGEGPHRVEHIETVIRWPSLPEERRAPVERAAAACTLHRTLEHPPQLVTRVGRS